MTSVRGYILRPAIARIRATKGDYDFRPTKIAAGAYPAMLMHQAGSAYVAQFASSLTPVSSEIGPMLATDLGIPSVAGELDGATGAVGTGMGTDTVMADMEAGRVLAKTLNPACDNSKMHLIGFSMGAHACLRYAILNPGKVASITTVVGLADAMQTYDDVPAQQANMRLAWGVADRAGLAASGFNTKARMNELNGVVPVQMFYSTADTTVTPATQVAIGALLGAALYPVSASLDHAAAEQIAGIVRDRGAGDWASIKDFIVANDPVL